MIVDDLRQPCTAFCEYESCTCDVFHGSMCVTEPVSDSLSIQLPAVSSGMRWKGMEDATAFNASPVHDDSARVLTLYWPISARIRWS